MKIYILRKGNETVEVTEGREERRDRLIRAGYVWINAVQIPTDVIARSVEALEQERNLSKRGKNAS